MTPRTSAMKMINAIIEKIISKRPPTNDPIKAIPSRMPLRRDCLDSLVLTKCSRSPPYPTKRTSQASQIVTAIAFGCRTTTVVDQQPDILFPHRSHVGPSRESLLARLLFDKLSLRICRFLRTFLQPCWETRLVGEFVY